MPPYRIPPPAPPPECDRCHAVIVDGVVPNRSLAGAPLCKPCFLGRNDVVAVMGVATLFAGAFFASGALVVGGVLILGLGALGIVEQP